MIETCPFEIVVDSNEQIPYGFQGMSMVLRGKRRPVEVGTITRRLPEDHGDYQIKNLPVVTNERKSLFDLYATLSPQIQKVENGPTNRDEFRKQCDTMNFFYEQSNIIIEADWAEVCNPTKYRTPLDWEFSSSEFFPDVICGEFCCEYDRPGTWTATKGGDVLLQSGSLVDCMATCERQQTIDDGWWRSKLNPRSVFATINSWRTRFPRVHWVAAGSRRLAEITCFEILVHAWKHEQES